MQTKCGYSGEDAPRACFPTIVGRPRHVGYEAFYVGDECQAPRGLGHLLKASLFSCFACVWPATGVLSAKRPIEQSLTTQWDDIGALYTHTFRVLRAEPHNRPVLLTEAVTNTRAAREKTAQIVFEEFKVPALRIAAAPVLAMWASGRLTGMVSSAPLCTEAMICLHCSGSKLLFCACSLSVALRLSIAARACCMLYR
jgi:actin-related protein